MHIPIYVITGFLDSGKTSFLNKVLNTEEASYTQTLLIQFESGEEDFNNKNDNCSVITFSKNMLENNLDTIVKDVYTYLLKNTVDEIWIEWNGVTPFSELQNIFLHKSLYKLCRFQKVIHIADANTLDIFLGKTGIALPEQISNCDLFIVRNLYSKKGFSSIKRTIKSINPDVKLFNIDDSLNIYNKIYSNKPRPINSLCIGTLFLGILYILSLCFLNFETNPINKITNVFLGIMLQSIPFLIIGVLISSIIQVFVSQETIEKRFPQKFGSGMIIAILGGFCLPVCDCASIPIFRSIVRKGVPLSVAVTFMTVTPIINPVVMLSTYNAFNYKIEFVAARVIVGIICAVLIGLCFQLLPSKKVALSNNFKGFMCNCGCYEDLESNATFKNKLSLCIRHSQAEFFNVGKYLVIGAFVASIFNVAASKFNFFHRRIKLCYFFINNDDDGIFTFLVLVFRCCSCSYICFKFSFWSNNGIFNFWSYA